VGLVGSEMCIRDRCNDKKYPHLRVKYLRVL
jgi:hypothetical protein